MAGIAAWFAADESQGEAQLVTAQSPASFLLLWVAVVKPRVGVAAKEPSAV